MTGVCIGQVQGDIVYTNLDDVPRLMDYEHSRPLKQWWMDLRPIARILASPGSGVNDEENRG